MSRESIFEGVKEIFDDLLDDPSIVVTEETSRENLEEWESLFHMTLIASVCEEFHIEIPTDDIVHIKDVKMLIDTIEKHLAA